MEYAFEVADPGAGRLSAGKSGQPTGRLDWSDFDLRFAKTLPLTGGKAPLPKAEEPAPPITFLPPEIAKHELLPRSIRFRGMPVSRFWEFEDRNVYLGDVDAGPPTWSVCCSWSLRLSPATTGSLSARCTCRNVARIDHLVVSNTSASRRRFGPPPRWMGPRRVAHVPVQR